MSRPMAETTKRRPGRQFDEEFKAQAVRLVADDGKNVGTVACDLDLTESALRHWVERARRPDERAHGSSRRWSGRSWLDCPKRIESCGQRDILKKAALAAFFAKHQS
jgi:transposase